MDLQHAEITPSYGRDYTSKAAAFADFEAGKDFTLAATGQQLSIRDVPAGTTVLIRYKRLTQVQPFTVTRKHLDAATAS